jgi:hypothetical protein
MSGAIGPGDWVQCVKTPGPHGTYLRLGGVYCISHFDDDGDLSACTECGDAGAGFHLCGVTLPWLLGAFCHCAFQPLGGRGSAKPAPEAVRELEDV